MRRMVTLLLDPSLAWGPRRPAGTAAAAPETWQARAREAYAAMQARFPTDDGALYRERAPARPWDRRYATLWPFSQALAATLAVAALPDGDPAALARARLLGRSLFAHYWDDRATPSGAASYPLSRGGGHKYYDDNIWLGLDLVELHRATGERRALDDAARVFAFVVGGWDDDPAHPAPGGIFWTQAPSNVTRDRNTVSNAPAAELALHLYALTGDRGYLDWAERTFAWVERTLRDPADGLYWDHIRLDGGIERTKWSYNQGAMLGAAALFHRSTGDRAWLERARQIAEASLRFYGTDDRLWAQGLAFNAIFFHNLHLLAATLDDDALCTPALRAYAERVWARGRDAASGLFRLGRGGRAELLDQAAAVRIFALLAAADPTGGGGEGG
jgi:uncharacterized protein YyaL (SSP411 family)